MKIPISISTRIQNPLSVKFLLCVILLEIFVGGGGRLIDIGPMSPRMILFGIGMAISVLLILKPTAIDRNIFLVIAAATACFLFSTTIGIVNGAEVSLLLLDIKQLFGFYSILFFYFVIRNQDDVILVTRLIKFSACILAVAYLNILILIRVGIIAFLPFYNRASLTGEVFFRGESGFFYKGFVYICIGLLFFLTEAKSRKLIIALLATAIVLTFTRGFFISILATYGFYHVFIRRNASKILIFGAGAVIALFSLWNLYYSKAFNRKQSDSVRLTQIEEVISATTPVSFFIGHGFGNGVPSRPDRMEIVYLEAFHKQGLIGLLFWAGLLAVNWIYFKKANQVNPTLAVPFVLASIFIYIQSFTNPYVNNPIGMTMVLLSIVCLRVIANQKPGVVELPAESGR
ncbi:MAG: hypothetical protein QM762_15715 [Chryseolinea sp.]